MRISGEDSMKPSLTFGSPIDGLLERLYAQHLAQEKTLSDYFTARAAEGSLDWNRFDERTNRFLEDKLIALDRSKAEFCYHVCRALRATSVSWRRAHHSACPRSFSRLRSGIIFRAWTPPMSPNAAGRPDRHRHGA